MSLSTLVSDGARVLIVDDSRHSRVRLSRIIQDGGHVVVGEAGTVQEAISAYREALPDLVLMDIVMPGRDGIAGVRALRLIDRFAAVIIGTSFGNRESFERAVSAGIVGFIVKPFQADRVLEEVGKTLARYDDPFRRRELLNRPIGGEPAETSVVSAFAVIVISANVDLRRSLAGLGAATVFVPSPVQVASLAEPRRSAVFFLEQQYYTGGVLRQVPLLRGANESGRLVVLAERGNEEMARSLLKTGAAAWIPAPCAASEVAALLGELALGGSVDGDVQDNGREL
ncbi:MAG: response regulator [Candidatus Schekmanbacteria bacterium]|nr:response regulator [Candidatus Schekmanbacteria bacterium]